MSKKTLNKNLPPELVATGDPEAMLDVLIRTGRFSEHMFEMLGGRAGAIKVIHYYLRNRNAHRLTAEDET